MTDHDNLIFNYLEERATSEYSQLVSVLGASAAEIELHERLQDFSHMLTSEDLELIGKLVVDYYWSQPNITRGTE